MAFFWGAAKRGCIVGNADQLSPVERERPICLREPPVITDEHTQPGRLAGPQSRHGKAQIPLGKIALFKNIELLTPRLDYTGNMGLAVFLDNYSRRINEHRRIIDLAVFALCKGKYPV